MDSQSHPPAALPAVGAWAAVHTKSRAEKVVAEHLRAQGVAVFLPLRLSRRTYGARVRESWTPLFPGYVFFDSTAIERRRVFDSRRVANVLVPEDPGRLARDLEAIARALAEEPSLERVAGLAAGTPVEVVRGPLKGVAGELVRQQNETRLVLRVDFTGFAAELTIDEAFLEPLDPDRPDAAPLP